MKKRLRKKNFRGEFAVWGAVVDVVRTRKAGYHVFVGEFLVEAIEKNACSVGGGGKEDRCGWMIQLGRSADGPEEKLRKVRAWLDGRDDVQSYVVGSIVDICYGPFDEPGPSEDTRPSSDQEDGEQGAPFTSLGLN